MSNNYFKRASLISNTVDQQIADGSVTVFTGNTLDIIYTENGATRILNPIAQRFADHGMPTIVYSLGGSAQAFEAKEGIVVSRLPKITAQDPATIALDELFAAMAREAQATGHGVALVVNFAEALVPCNNTGSAGYDTARIIEQIISHADDVGFQMSGSRLLLIECAGKLSSDVLSQPGLTTVQVPLPDEQERRAAIEGMERSDKLWLEADMDAGRFARLSGGMDLDSVCRLAFGSSAASPLTAAAVKEAKRKVIDRLAGGVLEPIDDDYTFDDVADLHNVKNYVRDLLAIGQPSVRMILAGPPGTGKTTSAVAIANALDAIPVLLKNPLSKWVGESEKNMANALDVVESCGRVLLIIDEADQGLLSSRAESASQESSSVYPALRGMIMARTGDTGNDSELSILLMTNNPQGLDAAVRNRMTLLPVLEAASAADRAAIMQINARKCGIDIAPGAALAAFKKYAQPIDGRRILTILTRARINAAKDGSETVSYDHLVKALNRTHCVFGATEQRASMTAVLECVHEELLPWVAAWDAGISEYAVPYYLERFVDARTGAVDYESLAGFLGESGD